MSLFRTTPTGELVALLTIPSALSVSSQRLTILVATLQLTEDLCEVAQITNASLQTRLFDLLLADHDARSTRSHVTDLLDDR